MLTPRGGRLHRRFRRDSRRARQVLNQFRCERAAATAVGPAAAEQLRSPTLQSWRETRCRGMAPAGRGKGALPSLPCLLPPATLGTSPCRLPPHLTLPLAASRPSLQRVLWLGLQQQDAVVIRLCRGRRGAPYETWARVLDNLSAPAPFATCAAVRALPAEVGRANDACAGAASPAGLMCQTATSLTSREERSVRGPVRSLVAAGGGAPSQTLSGDGAPPRRT